METKAIATLDTFAFPALFGAEAAFDPAEFDDISLDFPRVKIPSGGQIFFEIPNPADPEDPSSAKTIEGVIVLQHNANGFWPKKDSTNEPPDCSSNNGVTGFGNPGGNCARCPLNAFGSGEGGVGKACKNMKNIYILQDGAPMPLLLSLPPTSLKSFRNYANTLRYGGWGLSSVVTGISLKRMESGSNTYSIASFRIAGRLSPDLAKAAREYAKLMRQNLLTAAQTPADPDINPETGEILPF